MIATTTNLLPAALRFASMGLSVIPLKGKRPAIPSWTKYQTEIADDVTITRWFSDPAVTGVGIVCGSASGGLLVIDFDTDSDRLFPLFLAGLAESGVQPLVVTTGGGGKHFYIRCPGGVAGNAKLAWVADDILPDGREIAIETRGEGGYVCGPLSAHESGNVYEISDGSVDAIPTVTAETMEKILELARGFDEMPVGVRELAKLTDAHKATRSASRNGSGGVINQFNAATDLVEILRTNGYTSTGRDGVYRHPGKTSGPGSVLIRDGRSFHFSTNDPLNDLKFGVCGIHDGFDIFAHFEHGGGVKAAVKAAARVLGIEHEHAGDKSSAKQKKPAKKKREPQPTDPRATDTGNAEVLIEKFGADLRYDVDAGTYLHFVGSHWEVDKDGYAVRAAMEVGKSAADRLQDFIDDPKALAGFATRSESAAGINSALSLAKSLPGISMQTNQFNSQHWKLPANNGTIDLRTGKFGPHDREDYFTFKLKVNYNPEATCPQFNSFLYAIMAGKMALISYLQRWLGMCLTGDASVQELIIFYGSGANGKSTLLDLFLSIMGKFGCVAPESLLTASAHTQPHPTDVATLRGTRVAVASETENGSKMRLQAMKRLTGDAVLTARLMHQNFFEFVRTFKLILQSNNRPEISEQTEAAWRRIRLVPFAVTIPPEQRDPNLLEKLKAEGEGVLAWLVRGCLDWQRNGMNPPAEVLAATEEYRADNDPLSEYIAARCLLMDGVKVERGELFTDYTNWAKLAGDRKPLDRAQFYAVVRHVEGVTDHEWKAENVKRRGFSGITLCSSSPQNGGN